MPLFQALHAEYMSEHKKWEDWHTYFQVCLYVRACVRACVCVRLSLSLDVGLSATLHLEP